MPPLRRALTPEPVLRLIERFDPEHSRLTRLGRRWGEIAHSHQPEPCTGAVHLYISVEDTPEPATAAAIAEGWQRLAAGGVQLRQVGGNHISMLHPPHVAGLAEALERDLREVQP